MRVDMRDIDPRRQRAVELRLEFNLKRGEVVRAWTSALRR